MNYELRIEGMEFRAAHGCYETEQRVGGNFTVDIALDVGRNIGNDSNSCNEIAEAVVSDDMSRTVNYVEVYEIVRREMAIPSRIIENVAYRIAEGVKTGFPQVARVEVTVAKLAPPIPGKIRKVSVTLSR